MDSRCAVSVSLGRRLCGFLGQSCRLVLCRSRLLSRGALYGTRNHYWRQTILTSIRWVIGATLAMAGAMGIGRFAYTPLLPDMAEVFGWSYTQAGDVASANFLGYLVGAILAPKLSRSPYVRTWVALSLMSSTVTTLLGAYAISFEQWLLLRFCAGVASAFCLVVITTHLMQVLARHKADHLGNVHFAGVGMGILVCMAVVYLSVGPVLQWSHLGAVSAVLMVFAWFFLMQGQGVGEDGASRHWSPLSENGGAQQELDSQARQLRALPWRLITGYGFFGFSYIISATFVVAIAESFDSGSTWLDGRFVWVVVGLASIPSVYLWQWLANVKSPRVALVWAYLTLAVGVLLGGWASDLIVLSVACLLLGGTFGGVTALGLSAVRVLAPAHVALGVSTMTVAFSVGQLVGPAFAGRLADAYGGFFWPSVLASALTIIAAVLAPKRAAQ